MILGTHNSATSGKLLWWLKPIKWILDLTSKCQNKTINEQLEDGIKLFNLQITHFNNNWYFSHGLAIYEENLFETLEKMKNKATPENPIYFQLYLDKCFWSKQDPLAFADLVATIKQGFCCPYFVMLSAWVEGTNKYPHKSSSKIKWEERYWTLTGANLFGNWLDKIPLPKIYAKKYNKRYIENCKTKYLMLDFYNIN